MNNEILEIELSKITLNPFQPRKHFCTDDIEELAQSIRSLGMIQPPIVRFREDEGVYELIAGERRYRAAKIAGLEKIPVMVTYRKLAESAEASLVENIQRVDLTPIEVAKALKQLMVEFDYQQEDLAEIVGKKRSTVANYLRLLSLPKKIQESVASGEISMGHAKAILSVEGFENQLALHDQVLQGALSVREAEEAAQKVDQLPKRRLRMSPSKDCYLIDLEERLQQKFGTKVNIEGRGKQGEIKLKYYSLDDLDRILELIGMS